MISRIGGWFCFVETISNVLSWESVSGAL